jgi:hypothetical protein
MHGSSARPVRRSWRRSRRSTPRPSRLRWRAAANRLRSTVGGSDFSANASGFNGLLTTALKSGSGAYVSSLATGTAGTGTVLTASGKGSVNEIDQMMQTMWDSAQCSVSVLYVNSQEQKNITTKVLSSGSAPLLNYFQDPARGEYLLTAGGAVEYYYNPYLNKKIPIKVHPNLAPGTILGYAEDLPVQYQNSEVPNVAEVKTRRDYYQIDWPITTRAQMAGVYAEEVLAVYAPFAMGVIARTSPTANARRLIIRNFGRSRPEAAGAARALTWERSTRSALCRSVRTKASFSECRIPFSTAKPAVSHPLSRRRMTCCRKS